MKVSGKRCPICEAEKLKAESLKAGKLKAEWAEKLKVAAQLKAKQPKVEQIKVEELRILKRKESKAEKAELLKAEKLKIKESKNPGKVSKQKYWRIVKLISDKNARIMFDQRLLQYRSFFPGDEDLHLDHMVSIATCYKHNIPFEIVGSQVNLRLIPWYENVQKLHLHDCFSVEELMDRYVKFTPDGGNIARNNP